MSVHIVPTTESHIPGFHAAVDVVSRERRYLVFLAAPPIEQSVAFVRGLLADGGVQYVAVTESRRARRSMKRNRTVKLNSKHVRSADRLEAQALRAGRTTLQAKACVAAP